MISRVQASSRAQKWELYRQLFPPSPGQRVLDVGVSGYIDIPSENYFLDHYPYPGQITAVGIDEQSGLEQRYPAVTFVRADGRAMPFDDGSFDVVHSNAVIEHVGPRPEQQRFAAELVRVARAGFVTTPNRWFPVESHTRPPMPFVHWLPRDQMLRILDLTNQFPDGKEWHVWLLTAAEMVLLFPPHLEVTLIKGRLAGLPATLNVAFRIPA
jgi:ubiquinone/menaquinone biosynthesis C-methylase UbiE